MGGDGLPRLLPSPHWAGRSGMLGSHTARQAGQPRAVGGLWFGTCLHGRRRRRHPLTPSRGSQSARRCWIGLPRRQCVPACLAPADLLPVAAVVRLPTDSFSGGRESGVGAVHQRGLLPASALSTPVLLSTVGSITGLGIRPLSWPELAALWDVPILISDCLSEASGVDLLRVFCLSTPAKVLFVGADALLTTLFRGGTTFSSEGDTPGHTSGPAPKTDVKLGLTGLGFVTAHKTQAHVQVIKGGTQKADSAAVPDHLWVHAFLYGYGRKHHGPRHLHALALALGLTARGFGRGSRKSLPAGRMGDYSFRSLHPGPLPAVCTTPVAVASPAGFLCLAEAQHPSHQGLQPCCTDCPSPPLHKRGGGSGPFRLDNEGLGLLQGVGDVHAHAPRRTSDGAGWT